MNERCTREIRTRYLKIPSAKLFVPARPLDFAPLFVPARPLFVPECDENEKNQNTALGSRPSEITRAGT